MIVKITPDRNINTFTLGVEDDHHVERVIFKGLPAIGEPQLVTLHWVLIDDTTVGDIVELTATEDGYAWDVTNTITQYGKHAAAYIRITVGDQVWSTKEFKVKSHALPDINGVVAFTPSIIDQMLAAIAQHNEDMAAALSGAQEAQRAAEAASATTQADAAATAQDRARAEAAAAIAESGLHVVTLSIDEDGYLVQHMAGEGTAITFDVDTDGYLEVQING